MDDRGMPETWMIPILRNEEGPVEKSMGSISSYSSFEMKKNS